MADFGVRLFRMRVKGFHLSIREEKILQLLFVGTSSNEIARDLMEPLRDGSGNQFCSPSSAFHVTLRASRDLAKCGVLQRCECRCPRAVHGTILLKTILCVDDDPDVSEIIAMVLAEGGYSVITASDGYEAVRILVDHSVDLLITDVKMPGISGFELARQATLMRPNLHIIYVSGYNTDADRGAGPIYGVVLQKPIRPSHLHQEVNRQLSSGAHEVDA